MSSRPTRRTLDAARAKRHTRPMAETELKTARRHVTAGRERIRRQEALLARLRHINSPLISKAMEVLDQLSKTQVLFEEHLRDLENAAPR